jgi:hypothetical protein
MALSRLKPGSVNYHGPVRVLWFQLAEPEHARSLARVLLVPVTTREWARRSEPQACQE